MTDSTEVGITPSLINRKPYQTLEARRAALDIWNARLILSPDAPIRMQVTVLQP